MSNYLVMPEVVEGEELPIEPFVVEANTPYEAVKAFISEVGEDLEGYKMEFHSEDYLVNVYEVVEPEPIEFTITRDEEKLDPWVIS